MAECRQEDGDLVKLNQKLFLGSNPRNGFKRKSRYREQKGWKAYDTTSDNVKKRLIAENMIRKDNKKRLDFSTNAVNPIVYPNFESNKLSESESKKSELPLKKLDGISKNIERDNVVDGYQAEREESLDPLPTNMTNNIATGFGFAKQKYFIAQVRNYLPLVRDEDVRKKLKMFLRYLHDTSTANELTINEKGHVQRGLFDTQTKFSDYLNYYIMSGEEKLRVNKPLFYNEIIADPLASYLASNKQQNTLEGVSSGVASGNRPVKVKADPDVKETRDQTESKGGGITPLRNIKDSDLRLETSLPKMVSLLTSFNIDMGLELDKNDYENLIRITAFPIYATNPSGEGIESNKRKYTEFGDMLKNILKDGQGSEKGL